MSYTPPAAPQYPGQTTRRVVSRPQWSARQPSRPVVAPPVARVTRRFEVEWFDGHDIQEFSRVAPAFPVFEQAFGAFTHGALIHTTDGPVAVEDLLPGMFLECADGRVSQLLWKGSITLVPGAPTLNERPDRLYRVMPDAFGLGRPVQDQTFGPHARRLDRDAQIRATLGSDAALMSLATRADGHSVIEVTPVSPTRVYHLACEGHETILAAGLEVETYHPGPDAPFSLPEEMMQQFLEFFPYLSSLRDFGRLVAPRMARDELAAMA